MNGAGPSRPRGHRPRPLREHPGPIRRAEQCSIPTRRMEKAATRLPRQGQVLVQRLPGPRSPSGPSSTSTRALDTACGLRPDHNTMILAQEYMFPWCTRPARRLRRQPIGSADRDTEAEGTNPNPDHKDSSNLGALPRSHRDCETFTAWHTRIDPRPGTFEWTSPATATTTRTRPPPSTTHVDEPEPPYNLNRPAPRHSSHQPGPRLALMCTRRFIASAHGRRDRGHQR